MQHPQQRCYQIPSYGIAPIGSIPTSIISFIATEHAPPIPPGDNP
ncbi:hypothetical protein [Polluticoccus soli]|nr:hypothetical protein [Flavipsychrobacter sp. JY13-12]